MIGKVNPGTEPPTPSQKGTNIHTHARTHAHTHARMHTHTHTLIYTHTDKERLGGGGGGKKERGGRIKEREREQFRVQVDQSPGFQF